MTSRRLTGHYGEEQRIFCLLHTAGIYWVHLTHLHSWPASPLLDMWCEDGVSGGNGKAGYEKD